MFSKDNILLKILFWILVVVFTLFLFIQFRIVYGNYTLKKFVESERYEYISNVSEEISKRYCGEFNVQQLGFNNDEKHVDIICRDKSEIEIRIK